jgi:hypothetical protein
MVIIFGWLVGWFQGNNNNDRGWNVVIAPWIEMNQPLYHTNNFVHVQYSIEQRNLSIISMVLDEQITLRSINFYDFIITLVEDCR